MGRLLDEDAGDGGLTPKHFHRELVKRGFD